MQKQTGKTVVIKEMILNDEITRELAEVEAKALGGCNCASVVKVYDYQIIGNVAYVVLISIYYL